MTNALEARLRADLTTAMKARDTRRTGTIRMALAAIGEAAVAGASARELTDDDVEAVLRTQVKRRDEAAEAFRAGDRAEQAAAEEAERDILAEYLPAGLSADEIASIVDEALDVGGFTEPAQMGVAMKAVMGAVAGRADGKVVSALVKARLTS